MFCGKCGAENAPGTKFCGSCGAELEKENSGENTVEAIKSNVSEAATTVVESVKGKIDLKKFVKNKLTWIGIACIAVAVVIAVVSAVTGGGRSVVSKYAHAITTKNKNEFVSCFIPEQREDAGYYYEMLMGYIGIGSFFGEENLNGKLSYEFLQGEEYIDDEGRIHVPVTTIIKMGSEVTDCYNEEVTLIDEGGHQYIDLN